MIAHFRLMQEEQQNFSFGSTVGDRADTQIHKWTIVARSSVALHSCFKDGVSILNLRTGGYFRLEALGFKIWMILARPMTIEEIGAKLDANRAMEPDVTDTTMIAFIDSLRHAGLVVAT